MRTFNELTNLEKEKATNICKSEILDLILNKTILFENSIQFKIDKILSKINSFNFVNYLLQDSVIKNAVEDLAMTLAEASVYPCVINGEYQKVIQL
ncbi:MAG: hypothetical protein KBD37_10300 [Burkholderiales bacterium]|nr:hypothetical protein [Burkholderiales bacterium]